MLSSRGAGGTHREYAAPKKRVTFSGPVTSTRVNKPRPVGTEGKGVRQKHAVNLPPSSANQDLHRKFPLSDGSQIDRPHSKTTVLGTPLKTRLNCNHLRPKCVCSISANKKRAAKARQKKSLVSGPRSTLNSTHLGPRSTLLSTRTLPRGEINGRKTYTEQSDPVSVLEGNWQPGLHMGSVGNGEEVPNDFNVMLDISKETNAAIGQGDGNKKTVKFADSTRRELQRQDNSFKPNTRRQRPDGESEISTLTNHRSGYQTLGDINSKSNSHFSRHHSEPKVLSARDTVSSKDNQEQSESSDYYCRLCELARTDYSEDSMENRERTVPPYYADIPDPPVYLSDEPCLLCRRYGRDHYYINDEDRCELCESNHGPYTTLGTRKSEKVFYTESQTLHHPSSRLKENTKPDHSKARPSLRRQSSSPGLHMERNKTERHRTIPYEPRTDLVKDLKKGLEAEYRRYDYQTAGKRAERQWRSWDAEDTSKLASTQHHTLSQDPGLSHKCVHRYQQNDRLFLEPTLTNKEGRSVCSQCGAPQPTNTNTDPYLYHITLGGINDNDIKSNPARHRIVQNPMIGTKRSQKIGEYPSGDTSKHIYANLDNAISAILPGRSRYSLRPQSSSRIKLAEPHTKRPPSRSMALVDHLV